jgi:hypothetical protein
MQLLTEVQECISLMDKELNHFVEALLVSAKQLNQPVSLHVFMIVVKHSAIVSRLEGA